MLYSSGRVSVLLADLESANGQRVLTLFMRFNSRAKLLLL